MQFETFTVNGFGKKVSIPVFKFGKDSSKKLIVLGGVHGNEVNGIYNAKKVIDIFSDPKNEALLQGQIICLPVLNVVGFRDQVRTFYRKDLNRSYVSSNPKNFAEKFCMELFKKYFKGADYGLDFHDSGSNYELLPHSRIAPDAPILVEMTKAMKLKFCLVRQASDGMLADFSLKNDLPFLTIESGGARVVNEKFSHQLMDGLVNFLNYYGFLNQSQFDVKMHSKVKFLYARQKYKFENACVVKKFVKLGDRIKKGDLLCKLYDPSSSHEYNVFAKREGYVFSTPMANAIGANQTLCDIALDCCLYNVNANPVLFEIVKI